MASPVSKDARPSREPGKGARHEKYRRQRALPKGRARRSGSADLDAADGLLPRRSTSNRPCEQVVRRGTRLVGDLDVVQVGAALLDRAAGLPTSLHQAARRRAGRRTARPSAGTSPAAPRRAPPPGSALVQLVQRSPWPNSAVDAAITAVAARRRRAPAWSAPRPARAAPRGRRPLGGRALQLLDLLAAPEAEDLRKPTTSRSSALSQNW